MGKRPTLEDQAKQPHLIPDEQFEEMADLDRLGENDIAKVRDQLADGEWHKRWDIHEATGIEPDSIVARIADLRKARWGSQRIESREAADGDREYRWIR